MRDISTQNMNLQASISRQNALMEKLDEEFQSLKEVVSGHASTISDLEKSTFYC